MPDFTVDENRILQPLGVLVTGDSRYELLPSTRDNTEEIPGRDGEYDFGSEFKSRILELHCATDEGLSFSDKMALSREIAKHLDPTKGPKTLVFADDPDKTYVVKYSGKITPTNHPSWFDFVIPFKMLDPFIIGPEKSLTGSGVLVHEGTRETGLVIELRGPLTNPQIVIGNELLYYNGEIASGHTMVIDTANGTVEMDGSNAIDRFNKVFPLLYPGETAVVASSNLTIKWRDKWI